MKKSPILSAVLWSAALVCMQSSAAVEADMARFGTVLARTPVGDTGLTAWSLVQQGRPVVLYTTADGKAIFSGVVWDAKTKKNLSDPALNALRMTAPVAPERPIYAGLKAAAAVPALAGQWQGAIPEAIKNVAALSGIKEGKGGAADTLYIIVDPRCGYSRLAYRYLRPYVERGATVKWIPAPVLGEGHKGREVVAPLLASPTLAMLARQMGEEPRIERVPTKSQQATMTQTMNFFHAVFERAGTAKGVPVGFFLDHRTRQPRMIPGMANQAIIADILGDL